MPDAFSDIVISVIGFITEQLEVMVQDFAHVDMGCVARAYVGHGDCEENLVGDVCNSHVDFLDNAQIDDRQSGNVFDCVIVVCQVSIVFSTVYENRI